MNGSALTRLVCSLCGEALFTGATGNNLAGSASDANHASDKTSTPAKFEAWQWELDQELHDVRLLLDVRARQSRREPAERAPVPGPHFQAADAIQQDHDSIRNARIRTIHRAHGPERSRIQRPSRPASFAWLVLSFGLMALVCGGVLLIWSVVESRGELWQLGLPVALGGQAAMLFGFLLLLERMWRDNRSASEKLDTVDDEIDDLRHTASLLGSTQTGGPHSFYTHISEGAPPSLLLSDLKSQLDMLAVKIADRPK